MNQDRRPESGLPEVGCARLLDQLAMESAIMTLVTKKRYTAEFKAQAVELVRVGRSVKEVAVELEVGVSLLYAWVYKASQLAQLGSAGVGAVGEEPAADELRKLRREVANLKLENDILKKAAVILGTNPPSQPGR
jgi:transposase